MEYTINIVRSTAYTNTFVVEADNEEHARNLALQEAYDLEWSYGTAEYSIDSVTPETDIGKLDGYRAYIEENLERIEQGGWTPVCFAEFCLSEESDTYNAK